MYEFKREEYEKRITWFKEARFGLFIHWGSMPYHHEGSGYAVMNVSRRKITSITWTTSQQSVAIHVSGCASPSRQACAMPC